MAYIDVSTGSFLVTERGGPESKSWLDAELQRLEPAECLLPAGSSLDSLWQDNFSYQDMVITKIDEMAASREEARQILLRHLGVISLDGYGLEEYSAGIMAAGIIISFLNTTQKKSLNHIRSIAAYQNHNFMELDAFTRRNLELTSSLREGRKEGSLLAVVDLCRTPMGKRTLRKWLEQPLRDIKQINKRLDAVEELVNDIKLRNESREILNTIYDLERLAGKLGSGIITPRDLLTLKHSLNVLPSLSNVFEQLQQYIPTGTISIRSIDTSL